MADFTYDFTAQATANPWTIPSPLMQISTQNSRVDNGSGVKSATNGVDASGAHNVAYTGGSTPIIAGVVLGTVVNDADICAAGIFARSGGNAKAGYLGRMDGANTCYIDIINAAGSYTNLVQVGSITYATDDLWELRYVQSTNTLTLYQNGVQRLTTTDSTYNADTTLAPGWWVGPGNINAQYIKQLQGTGVASAGGGTANLLSGKLGKLLAGKL